MANQFGSGGLVSRFSFAVWAAERERFARHGRVRAQAILSMTAAHAAACSSPRRAPSALVAGPG